MRCKTLDPVCVANERGVAASKNAALGRFGKMALSAFSQLLVPLRMTGIHITRHRGVDRLFHWLSAVALLVLLFTGIAPGLGVNFAWVTPHWIIGIVLTLLVLLHTVRAIFWQDWRSMLIGPSDLRIALAGQEKPGKYSLAQKSMHSTVTVLSLVAIVTGVIMMAKIDTPFWERDPYWLGASTWGVIYVLHGLSAMLFVTVILLHIYFAFRPEKLFYTRSMIRGWITNEELRENHDPEKWSDANP